MRLFQEGVFRIDRLESLVTEVSLDLNRPSLFVFFLYTRAVSFFILAAELVYLVWSCAYDRVWILIQ